MYLYKNGRLPESFDNMFFTGEEIHNYSTSNKSHCLDLLSVTESWLAANYSITIADLTNSLKDYAVPVILISLLSRRLLQLPTEIDLLRQLLQSYGISYRLPLDKATVLIVLKGL